MSYFVSIQNSGPAVQSSGPAVQSSIFLKVFPSLEVFALSVRRRKSDCAPEKEKLTFSYGQQHSIGAFLHTGKFEIYGVDTKVRHFTS